MALQTRLSKPLKDPESPAARGLGGLVNERAQTPSLSLIEVTPEARGLDELVMMPCGPRLQEVEYPSKGGLDELARDKSL